MGIIRSIIDFVTKNTKLILFILLVVAVGFAYGYRDAYVNQKAETQKQKDNIEALQDSVRTVTTKNGDLQQEKLALQSDTTQLRTLNAELADELQNQKGKVEQLTQLVGELEGQLGDVETDSGIVVESRTSPVGLSNYKFTWSKSDSGEGWSKILEGYFIVQADSSYKPRIVENKITRDLLNMQIFTGIKTVDDKKTIFVRSTYPGLNFTDINGAVISEENEFGQTPSRWGIGVQLGYGYSVNSGLFEPYIGVGVTYSLIRF